ncbi:Uncharacterized protein MNEG_13874 [Monoraphidium neglectum]|uniref:NECAP PHear domain-containing protein n=1 Tax=Monoraphidium neglectum TaxID=145388 RepID=A0A0D2KE37_9CHLO|nr:Uncharacterized protein MNEG_13874 [Monoraphidium neglectum]KIY94088.1 Uncharacterized protein MNEG_13874 [Monoraphidium neglectum]|eukprot:XP_013893108.1 Uncharacterized protein MNEG_13874 [Monoraphidium neglectum]
MGQDAAAASADTLAGLVNPPLAHLACPVEFGKRAAAVEPVVDSSRYFVLRVVDPESGRHAFLGLGFDDRGDAFDFTAALSDHERRLQRERDTAAAAGAGRAGAASPVGGAAAALYQDRGDLSLRQGQTIRIELKKSGSRPSSGGSGGGASGGGGGGGFLQRAPSVPLAPLAPPPVGALGPPPVLAPPPPPASSSAPGDSALQGPAARAAAPPKARSGNPFDSEDGEDAGPLGGDGAGSGGGTLRVSRAGGGGADDGQGAGSQEAPGGQRQEGEGWAAF